MCLLQTTTSAKIYAFQDMLYAQTIGTFFEGGVGQIYKRLQTVIDRKQGERHQHRHVWTSHPLGASVLTPVLQKKGIYEDEWLLLWGHPSTPFNICLCTFSRERDTVRWMIWKGALYLVIFLCFFFFFLQLAFVFHNLLHFTHHTWNSLALATFKAVDIKSATTRTSGNYESSKDRRV